MKELFKYFTRGFFPAVIMFLLWDKGYFGDTLGGAILGLLLPIALFALSATGFVGYIVCSAKEIVKQRKAKKDEQIPQ